ncbi:MAG: 2-C-methyl-D-erythritol 2,4-cyclodiphosphate synthase, partial [Clostridiales bacterium]|nr:2-C-methyl-D-erythritol 2,4-cyclodiphosphate synthase [Clostridiales bacterium]
KIFTRAKDGKTVIEYSVGAFFGFSEITKIVISAKATDIETLKGLFGIYSADTTLNTIPSSVQKPRIEIIEGGTTRARSVQNALAHLDTDCDIVLIHDGARPYVSTRLVRRVIRNTERYGSAIPVLPVRDTLKRLENSHDKVLVTVERESYFTVSTPQGFLKDALLRAYALEPNPDGFTDDSSLYAAHIGEPLAVDGQEDNHKITAPDDVLRFMEYSANAECSLNAECRMQNAELRNNKISVETVIHNTQRNNYVETDAQNSQPRADEIGYNANMPLAELANSLKIPSSYRIGTGYDLHRLTQNRPLILGGVTIDYPLGLFGHSDADVLLHAITDALLAAADLPDIGRLFSDTDPQYANADSKLFLSRALDLLRQKGGSLVNISSVIIAEAPKLAPHIEIIKASLAALLALPLRAVSISAKTNETLDLIGNCKAIAAQCVCLVKFGL